MNRRVNVNDVTGEITKIYQSYTDEVMQSVNEAVREVATESRDQLKVAGDFQDRTGKYRKGWRITFNEMRYGLEAVIHNKLYPLTHLLESGHAKFLWGRDTGETVRAFPHIEQVNNEAQRRLEEEIIRRIEQ